MRRAALLALVAALSVAGCGGDEPAPDATTTTGSTNDASTVTAPTWVTPYLQRPGPEGAALMASSDFAVGKNRVTFVLVRPDNALVRAPIADVYYLPGTSGPPVRATARLERIGDHTAAPAEDVTEVYAAELSFTRPGDHWIAVVPRGAAFQWYQILKVARVPTAVSVGERAPASENPTTATAAARRITTARPPDTGLLRYTVADSLASRSPFVLVLATPAFCQSRTCGPTVAVVDEVRRRLERRGVRFIHIEIYEDNVPGNGPNRWVKEWRLPTEPWVFVVGSDGVVRDRFEGPVSVAELTDSVRRHLLRR